MKQSLKIVFRNFKNKPTTYLVNFIGLSLSLSLALILSVYCYSEFSADSCHVDGNQIYFLYNEYEIDSYGGVTSGILKQSIDSNIAEVQNTLRIRNSWLPATFKTNNRNPITTNLVYADESFFNFFSFKCVAGNPETALKDPLSLVLMKSEAEKLFGTTQVVGETVLLNTQYPLTVTAVIEPIDQKSFLTFKAISPVSTIKSIVYDYSEGDYNNWGQRNFLTFVKLKSNSQIKHLEQKITSLYPEDKQKNTKIALMSLKDVYLNNCGLDKLLGFLSYIKKGNKSQLFILMLVSGLILLIALINYINISSSHRLETLKQTGMQKIIGASRLQIYLGIATEAHLIFLCTTIVAFIITITMAPQIANIVGFEISTKKLLSPIFIGAVFFTIVVIGFIVSIIPALKLSKANVVDLIKNLNPKGKRKFTLQSLNVAAQFSIAIILIAFTLFIFKQIKFGFSTIGYDDENCFVIKINDQLYSKSNVLKEQILKSPEVTNASLTRFYPGKPGININGGEIRDAGDENKKLDVNWMYADADFLKALDLQMIKGEFLEERDAINGNKIVVNETFAREHGISTNPVGKNVYYSSTNHEIIGVVKDFHLNSVNAPIVPLVLTNVRPRNKFNSFYMLFNVQATDSENLHETMEKIKSISESISTNYPVELSFMDAAVGEMYKSEVQFRQVIFLFAGSSIFISCLGIFALSLFDSRRRIKEIGVRKVNGAKISEVILMLNKDFIKWVAIAFVIATPIAYYAMHKWLSNFAYKTELSWWIFALAGLMALGIALLTVSWQSWKAATRNPVEALRYE